MKNPIGVYPQIYNTDGEYLDRKAELEQMGAPFSNISPDSSKFASKMRAAMARDVWEDYQNRYEPYEEALIQEVTNPLEELDERLSAIKINNRQSFQSAREDMNMARGRYGVGDQGVQRRAAEYRGMRQAAVMSEVDARNNTRTHIMDRNMAVIAGGGSRQAIEDTA